MKEHTNVLSLLVLQLYPFVSAIKKRKQFNKNMQM